MHRLRLTRFGWGALVGVAVTSLALSGPTPEPEPCGYEAVVEELTGLRVELAKVRGRVEPLGPVLRAEREELSDEAARSALARVREVCASAELGARVVEASWRGDLVYTIELPGTDLQSVAMLRRRLRGDPQLSASYAHLVYDRAQRVESPDHFVCGPEWTRFEVRHCRK